jgi:hypothetical protein
MRLSVCGIVIVDSLIGAVSGNMTANASTLEMWIIGFFYRRGRFAQGVSQRWSHESYPIGDLHAAGKACALPAMMQNPTRKQLPFGRKPA